MMTNSHTHTYMHREPLSIFGLIISMNLALNQINNITTTTTMSLMKMRNMSIHDKCSNTCLLHNTLDRFTHRMDNLLFEWCEKQIYYQYNVHCAHTYAQTNK